MESEQQEYTTVKSAINIRALTKNLNGAQLNIEKLSIPQSFSTALIGENGAGKSSLLRILAGIDLDYNGEIKYFDNRQRETVIRELIGYTSPNNYFLQSLNIKSLGKSNQLLYDNFSSEKYYSLCKELGLTDFKKHILSFSDGMKMKTALASVLARDTKLLLLDEPDSQLDPLMRDKLCSLIRDYLDDNNEEKTIFFSTHNIADMESVTDYAVIMARCEVVEQGFVEDLKEKYVLVKGEPADAEKIKQHFIGFEQNSYGFEGICLSEKLDRLIGFDIAVETPTLSQISVAIMKKYTLSSETPSLSVNTI